MDSEEWIRKQWRLIESYARHCKVQANSEYISNLKKALAVLYEKDVQNKNVHTGMRTLNGNRFAIAVAAVHMGAEDGSKRVEQIIEWIFSQGFTQAPSDKEKEVVTNAINGALDEHFPAT